MTNIDNYHVLSKYFQRINHVNLRIKLFFEMICLQKSMMCAKSLQNIFSGSVCGCVLVVYMEFYFALGAEGRRFESCHPDR